MCRIILHGAQEQTKIFFKDLSYKRVLQDQQECLAGTSSEGKVSDTVWCKSVPQECAHVCLSGVFHDTVFKECLTRKPQTNVLKACPTRVSDKSVLQQSHNIVIVSQRV